MDTVSNAITELEEKTRELQQALSTVETAIETEREELETTRDQLQKRRAQLERELDRVTAKVDKLSDESFPVEDVAEFLQKPYTIVPKSENEVWVIAPRWVPFHIGILQKQDETYNHFVVNQYVDWIEEIPQEIKDRVGIEKEFDEVTMDEQELEFSSEDERESAWNSLGGRDGGLFKRVDDTKIQIKSGSEFDVLAELIERGNLPFKPNSIPETAIRSESTAIELREYQHRAWDKFLETGMIGVYWPPGLGKTFFGLYAGDRLAGEKLVVVPSTTLREQWTNRIDEFVRNPSEWTVETYQYLCRGDNIDEFSNRDLALTIIDEAHYIPGSKFSKISLVDTEYRIGLSATPYREDEKQKYIFALTGYPVGLNWEEYLKYDVLDYPDVTVLLHRTERQKTQTVQEKITNPGKIVIFCDSISKGKSLAKTLDVPFVYGETTNKLEKIKQNRVIIVSRVGDEGVSIPDVETVIEYDFHGGSRRQELQRAGRLMHGDDSSGTHYVLMTDDEYEKFGQRLYSLEEKGYDIRIIRNS